MAKTPEVLLPLTVTWEDGPMMVVDSWVLVSSRTPLARVMVLLEKTDESKEMLVGVVLVLAIWMAAGIDLAVEEQGGIAERIDDDAGEEEAGFD